MQDTENIKLRQQFKGLNKQVKYGKPKDLTEHMEK